MRARRELAQWPFHSPGKKAQILRSYAGLLPVSSKAGETQKLFFWFCKSSSYPSHRIWSDLGADPAVNAKGVDNLAFWVSQCRPLVLEDSLKTRCCRPMEALDVARWKERSRNLDL